MRALTPRCDNGSSLPAIHETTRVMRKRYHLHPMGMDVYKCVIAGRDARTFQIGHPAGFLYDPTRIPGFRFHAELAKCVRQSPDNFESLFKVNCAAMYTDWISFNKWMVDDLGINKVLFQEFLPPRLYHTHGSRSHALQIRIHFTQLRHPDSPV